MFFRSEPIHITVILFMGMACFVLWRRSKNPLDLDFPILFWIGLLALNYGFTTEFHPYALYIGLASALLIRFEFMANWITKFTRGLEFLMLAYVLYHGADFVLM